MKNVEIAREIDVVFKSITLEVLNGNFQAIEMDDVVAKIINSFLDCLHLRKKDKKISKYWGEKYDKRKFKVLDGYWIYTYDKYVFGNPIEGFDFDEEREV
ncbi:MAG: hypothetical protein ACLUQ0_08660 [Enterococcus italicus]|uniref:hypothetical protein n=1 Tax=Enterococcus italicus TaxID=246144 RepID=UPI0028AF1908|nr:hypothetical protein [Enterococcus italicus]